MKNLFFIITVIAVFFTAEQPLEARVSALRGLRNTPTIKRQINRAQQFLFERYVQPKRNISTSRAVHRVNKLSSRATEILGFKSHQAIAFNGNTVVFKNLKTNELSLFNLGTQKEEILPLEEEMIEIYSVMIDENQEISAIARLENGVEDLVVWNGEYWESKLELTDEYRSAFIPNDIYRDLHGNIEGIVQSGCSRLKMDFRFQKIDYKRFGDEIEFTYSNSNGELMGRFYGDQSVFNRVAAVRKYPYYYRDTVVSLVSSMKEGHDVYAKRGIKFVMVDGSSTLVSAADGTFYILK